MTVYCVSVCDAEGCRLMEVCATKEIAERILFEARDTLVKGYKDMMEFDKKEGYACEMWERMINALSSSDYESWDNYPHETPSIDLVEVLDK